MLSTLGLLSRVSGVLGVLSLWFDDSSRSVISRGVFVLC